MSFDKVKKALTDIGSAINLVDTEIKQLIGNIDTLGKNLDKSQGLKDLTANLSALNNARKEADTLTKQQIDLQKKQEQLRRLQASAVKAEQAAIDAKNNSATKEQLLSDKLAKSQEQLTREKIKTANAAKKQANQAAKLTSAYARQSKALTLLRNRAKDLAIRFGENSNVYKQAEKRVIALNDKLTKLDRRLGQGQRDVGKYSKALGGLKNILGAAGVVGGFQLFFNVLRSGFKLVKEFEKENAVLAGVLGKTRKEIKPLTDDAKRLGSQTAKTAKEVTELQVAYARLGFSQDEIINLTEDTINGSIALNANLAETADLTGAVVRSFDDLSTNDADKILDQLTLSTQKSALSFDKLKVAIPIVGGAASAAGVKFETMIAQLGQAADRGIDASTAATSLRNIYIELSAKGLTLKDALSQINKSQDKLTTATDLFGKRAAVTALALANTVDKTDEFERALNNAGGTAKSVADEQLNTLDGQIQLMTSAWEGFILGLGKTGPIKEVIALLTNLITVASGFTPDLSLSKNLIGDEKITDKITEIKQTIQDLEKELFAIQNKTEEEGIIAGLIGEDTESEIKRVSDLIAEQKLLLDDYTSGRVQVKELTESIKLQSDEVDRLSSLFQKTGDPTLNKQIEDRLIIIEELTAKLNTLKDSNEELLKNQGDSNLATGEEIESTTDLIKIQEELLKKAKDLDGSTESNIASRNRKIESIEAEIKRLKELGVAQVPDKIKTDINKQILDAEKQLLEDQEALDEEEYNAFVEQEDKKTEYLKLSEEKRKELKQQAADFGIELANSLFEKSKQDLADETEEIARSYDERLAIEGLSEEQRSLIEAEREKKLNEQKAKKRELEKKQFLFNQGVKLGEIAIDTVQKVAEIKATAAVLAANPLTLPLVPLALAQVPITIASGALAAGLVSAQAIPQFDKGTDNFPYLGLVAEKRPEFVINDGVVELFNKPTLLGSDYKGSKVIGGSESAKILTNKSRVDMVASANKDPQIDFVNAQILSEIQKGNRINRMKQKITIINSSGINSDAHIGHSRLTRRLSGN